tara:strand:+ start:477 stop:1106 length:630 start_codon:yes stop_codon:yes gene_type:complete
MALIKLNNKAVSNATAFGSISSLGSMTFIKKLTASGSGTLSFVDGASGVVLDDTYKEYVFTFKDIHGSADSYFSFNGSIDGGSNYNVVKTTTVFNAYHYENDGGAELHYDNNSQDLAQSTAFQSLTEYQQNSLNDSASVGTLHLFNPSSTTFLKNFIINSNFMGTGGPNQFTSNSYIAGYFNNTNDIDAIRFQMSSGNFDGDICLYGIA